MENPFTTVTVRIYSLDLASSLNESFKRAETSFASNKSAFLVHLIKLGLATYDHEIEVKRQNPLGPSKETPTDIDDFQDMLDEYIKYSRKTNEVTEEKLEVCECLASAILNILLDSIEGKFVDKEAAEAGHYDGLPRRFKKGKGKD